jgi:hypothetical protein
MMWTVEIGEAEITYEADYSVSPGCPETPRSFSSGGEPACGPEVDDVSVYYCPTTYDLATRRHLPKRDAAGKRIRERRPELDEALTDAEVIEYALGADADAFEAAAEARAESMREARRYPQDAGRGASTSTGYEE